MVNNVLGLEIKKRLQDIEDLKSLSAIAEERSLTAEEKAQAAEIAAKLTKEQLNAALDDGDQLKEVLMLRVDPATQITYDSAADMFAENQRKVNEEFRSTRNKLGVSYAEFGAVLDGVTDDTEAIRATHNYANQYGLPVIQRNSTFVLNGEIEVQTDVDLTGSKLITTWVDPEPIEYNRTYILYRITGDPATDITDQVIQAEFKKGATTISSLGSFGSGGLIIRTTERDLWRNDAGSMQTVLKAESNALGEVGNGELMYPLTKDYSSASGFKVLYTPKSSRLTFKMPRVILKDCALFSIVKSERNNVEIIDVGIQDEGTSDIIAPLHTIAEFSDSHNIQIYNIDCPIIGRKRTGQNGRAYLFLFTRSSKIKIDNVSQLEGWGSIDGNWFRDLTIDNSAILNVSGHANAYDISVKNSRIYSSISVHGGGILDVDNVIFEGRKSSVAITTRNDYAGEFEGLIRVRNSESIKSHYFVQINGVNYDCGRKVHLPDVEIENCHMKNRDNQYTYFVTWRGFTGDFPAELPSIKVDGYSLYDNGLRHKTLFIPEGALDNKVVSGTIDITIKNTDLPITAFKRDPLESANANYQLPSIPNDDLKINLKIQNSLANFQVFGTSNIDISLEDCDFYAIRTGTGDHYSITRNGDPIKIDINNSRIHKGFTDLQTFQGSDRINLSITNSEYVKYYDRNGQTDSEVGHTLMGLIKYASNNKAEATSVLPNNPTQLFSYFDSNYWIQPFGGIYWLTLSNVTSDSNIQYYRDNDVVSLAIDKLEITAAISGYGSLTIGTLPVGYRPKADIFIPLTSDNATYNAMLNIQKNGTVQIHSRQYEIIPANTPFRGYAVFV